MAKRKFKTINGEFVEVTPDGERAVCDQISQSVEKYKEPLEFGLPLQKTIAQWPMTSVFASVNIDKVPELKKQLKQAGVPTEFDGECPIWTSREHKKKYLKATGQYDRDASYGDAAPENYVESSHSEKTQKKEYREYRQDLKRRIAQLEREIFS